MVARYGLYRLLFVLLVTASCEAANKNWQQQQAEQRRLQQQKDRERAEKMRKESEARSRNLQVQDRKLPNMTFYKCNSCGRTSSSPIACNCRLNKK